MDCPNCGGEMWDNRQNKKNPKAPDYKCKDKNCIDPETNFVTAVWLPKEKTQPKPQPKPQTQPNETSHKLMVLSYAKDLVVAQIKAGKIPEQVAKEVISTYQDLLAGFKELIW